MAESNGVSRRNFLAAGAVAAAVAAVGSRAFAAGPEKLRMGLVGCGGRGRGAVLDALKAADQAKIDVTLVALADLFPDRLSGARTGFKGLGAHYDVTDERCFTGFDAYRKLIDCGVDYVLLATPPGFRPVHLRYAVEQGKHVFFEKPCAVDPAGARSVMETAKLAKAKGTGMLAGTLFRHATAYQQTIAKLKDGAIGTITAGQVYYNTGELWLFPRQPAWSDAEWQLRNWYYFAWLSGDHIVEQHVHNLDVLHWVMGPPLHCTSIGGRQKRTDPAYGHIYDHFVTDYEWANGVHVMSSCRQQNGTAGKNNNQFVGTAGRVECGPTDTQGIFDAAGKVAFEVKNPWPEAYTTEHFDFFTSLQKGEPLNEGQHMAESSLLAIMARMSAYSGKEVSWEFALNKSKLDLWPAEWKDGPSFGPMATPQIAIPGVTPLI